MLQHIKFHPSYLSSERAAQFKLARMSKRQAFGQADTHSQARSFQAVCFGGGGGARINHQAGGQTDRQTDGKSVRLAEHSAQESSDTDLLYCMLCVRICCLHHPTIHPAPQKKNHCLDCRLLQTNNRWRHQIEKQFHSHEDPETLLARRIQC